MMPPTPYAPGVQPAQPAQAPGAVVKSAGDPSNVVELDFHELVRPEEISFGDCLGSGGFGSVYRCTLRGIQVAVKRINVASDAPTQQHRLQELRREIDSLRFLRHPRLVRFLGACLTPPSLCVITEFMQGGSLHDLLHVRRTPLHGAQRRNLALQVAEAIVFLHGHSPPVVHRDLKSMNILLDLQVNAKLCDFGLTMPMDPDKTHFTRRAGGESGSPRYMAPEFFIDTAKITEKIDIWAMGCVLIEVFGGPIPLHDCASIEQICARLCVHRTGPAVPAQFSPALRGAVQRCLEFDVGRRCRASDAYAWLTQLPPEP